MPERKRAEYVDGGRVVRRTKLSPEEDERLRWYQRKHRVAAAEVLRRGLDALVPPRKEAQS